MDFYAGLAPHYDKMINFAERIDSETTVFKSLLEQFPGENILDAGCGTGLHCIVFSGLGKKVSGFDPSEEMLRAAKQNANKFATLIRFYQTDYLNFDKVISDSFDTIFCLGNSFVHLLTRADIKKALLLFRSRLNRKGTVVLQILNYDKILKYKQSRISKKKVGTKTFQRYYTFSDSLLTFNLEIKTTKDKQHFITKLYPLQSLEIIDLARQAGYHQIELYGDFKLNPFDKEKSENICAFLLN